MKITIVATATVAGAFLALSGAGLAYASTTTGRGGGPSGNQASVQSSIPVDDCGDMIALQWVADAECAGAAWADGVSWDGGYTSGADRVAGVSWDGGFISDAGIIGGQFGLPVNLPIGGCGSGIGYDPSSCQGGTVKRGHPVTPLSQVPPCPCVPVPCSCGPVNCSCGSSHGHHISPHKAHRYPVGHAAHIPTPVASRAHGTPTPVMGMLPITGVNLAGIAGSGLGLLGTGAGALVGAGRLTNRKRRRSPA